MSDALREDLVKLEAHYTELAHRHGDSHATAQLSSQASQDARMRVLADIGDITHAKVLDLGCGTGRMLTVLRESLGFEGEYVGFDITEAVVDLARSKHTDARFERRDILAEGVGEDFDYCFISGLFNNRIRGNGALMTGLLSAVWPHCRKGLAFNAISNYVDWFDEGLWYVDPADVFRFCKETLSPAVTLRNDYQVYEGAIPFEFAVYVRNIGVPCRTRKIP